MMAFFCFLISINFTVSILLGVKLSMRYVFLSLSFEFIVFECLQIHHFTLFRFDNTHLNAVFRSIIIDFVKVAREDDSVLIFVLIFNKTAFQWYGWIDNNGFKLDD